MKKRFKPFNSIFGSGYVMLILIMLVTVVSAVCKNSLTLPLAVSTVIGVVIMGITVFRTQRIYRSFVSVLEDEASPKSKLLSELPFPVVYTYSDGQIIWYNSFFKKCCGDDCYGEDITELLKLDSDKMLVNGYCDIAFCGRNFTVYHTPCDAQYPASIYFLIDNTALKKAANEYYNTRPVVMTVTVDNFYEVTKSCRDSEKSAYRGAIHREIENWLTDIPCITLNQNDNGIFVLMEERHLRQLINGRFSVLEAVRKLEVNAQGPFTLSIGVGRYGKTPEECETLCVQALEMAQSRGGDQAAIKTTNNEYSFFGGVSKAAEKHTKVRARAVSSALYRMILASDKVILMGHKYSDIDCLGACYALSSLARQLKKTAYIVFNSKNTLALPLYKQIINGDSGCVFTTGSDDSLNLTDKTLLIIADVHRPDFVENKSVFEKCKNVVVIDHHRKSVDAISNAVVFYHETATSSTCEMVTELLQYMEHVEISPLAANALLGGIMLDTKSFCFHTGIRTFEASAYLRSLGADPIAVKKLFADDMRTFIRKSAIISASQLYEDCAISYDEVSDDITRIATSQAADELLYLENVRASFVMCRTGDMINISARSFGEINVQLIMELLGGGGHRNMAACQIAETDFNAAKQKLLAAINEYKKSVSYKTPI